MKNLKKFNFFIVIMFIASFFILSIFGIKSRWGDTIKHHFKGVETIKWSSDFDDSVEISLAYDRNASEENIDGIRYVISKRLRLMGINDFFLYLDKSKNIVRVNIPESASKPNFDFRAIAESLQILGNMKISVKDKDDNMFASLFNMYNKDSSKNEQIADDYNVVSADVKYSQKNRGIIGPPKNIPIMSFALDPAAKEKFNDLKKRNEENERKIKDLEEEVKKSGNEIKDLEEKIKKEKEENKQKNKEEDKKEEDKEKQKTDDEKKLEELKKQKSDTEGKIKELKNNVKKTVEIHLDNELIYSGDLTNSFNDAGNLEVQNFKLKTWEVLKTINIVSSGRLPSKLTLLDMKKLSPSLGVNYKQNIYIFCLVLIILSLAFIFIKYKFMVVVAALCIFGHFGFLVACLTGFFPFLPGVFVNMSSVMGVISSLMFGVTIFVFLANRIINKLININNLELAINRTFKENSKLIVKTNLLVIVTSLVIMSMFVAEKNDIFSNILSPITSLLSVGAQNEIFSFSYAIFTGTVGCLIFQYILPKFILKSISGFKYFKNAKIYGGKAR